MNYDPAGDEQAPTLPWWFVLLAALIVANLMMWVWQQ